ncbi:hypothetical protein Rumeso_00415 [Rubellimicrobium mesophilum DSM 19309]|uniref:Uncharacterized protein n=1 Tax=Rubellimicrobium mesophilum DSM 19309 TaxID=442562 RepID=A0A017HW23_9RHOB|nr:hypothetical protein [Rubellimicrobium mesophilum]EYD77954.1 hypothetical protein Rumeso_00415 [Rubellimicrobium mesophilum DSM 19309]
MARKKIIPKRIGGVKIPKNLRKLGDNVLSDPRAREVAGSALLALGSALASRKAPKGSFVRNIFDHPTEAAKTAEGTGADAARKAGDVAGGVSQAVNQVVTEVVETIRRDWARKTGPARAKDADDAQPEPGRDGDEDRFH